MTLEHLLWVVVVLLLALAIVVLNDRIKTGRAAKTREERAPGSALGLLICIVVTGAVIGVGTAYARYVPSLGWLVPVVFGGIVLLVVVFLLRKLIWLYLSSILTGRLPRVIRRNANGHLEIKCPRCSYSVPVTLGREGETAFECPHCGEKATWASEMKP